MQTRLTATNTHRLLTAKAKPQRRHWRHRWVDTALWSTEAVGGEIQAKPPVKEPERPKWLLMEVNIGPRRRPRINL